jgi:hypothetical protein
MTLTANREVDHYVDQELRSYRVAGGVHVFKGGFVGIGGNGYARPLVAGDLCAGLAYEEADNTAGSDGDVSVRVMTLGDFEHDLIGATLSDIGRPVFAGSDDGLTFSTGSGSFVGYVQDWVSANRILLRLTTIGPVGTLRVDDHASDFMLRAADSGSLHTNRTAREVITATLPAKALSGTHFRILCLSAHGLTIKPLAPGVLTVDGRTGAPGQAVSINRPGADMQLIADGRGNWIAVGSGAGPEAVFTDTQPQQ